ncbi:uncharacterized protein TRUGW13939_10879 [Talaromyces rugulosus]|uniref:Putative 5'-nucleotidase C-terminal domain-containing protein n=1 Tax=Talaromyces rugulosus TaxID=121627 RepID=A0A7H8RCI4_TALRU|nr:uncharacterized protein TRUGW13939_10879 [Talaromyces rugulosus]QKX63708.1 hypothetical protein TRUGW13939_10879 [Talaromyces rugulosus]
MAFLFSLLRLCLLYLICHTVACVPANQKDDKRLSRRMQLDAQDVLPKRQLEWGQINFIHTTDLHGWYEGHMKERNYRADWGDFISFIQHMRDRARQLNVDLLVVDIGDLHDGAGLSDVTKPDGLATDELFKMTDFDLLTVGNHELVDAGLPNATHMNLAKHFGDKYITSNVYVNDTSINETDPVPIGSLFHKLTTPNGLRIMAFGVLFDMNPPAKDTQIHLAKDMVNEDWFKNAVDQSDIDLFVLIGHNPARLDITNHDNNSTLKFITETIQKSRPDIPVQVFSSHSHIRDFMVYNENSTALQSGKYGDTVGWLAMTGIKSSTYKGVMNPAGVPNPRRPAKPVSSMSMNETSETADTSSLKYARRYLDFNRQTFQFHTNTSGDDTAFDTTDGLGVSKKITELRTKYHLTQYFGCAPRSYCISCRPHDDEGNIYNLVRKALEKIVVSPTGNTTSRLIFANRNGIRYDLAQGPFMRDDSYIVCPFTDGFRVVHNVSSEHASKILGSLDIKCPSGKGEMTSESLPVDDKDENGSWDDLSGSTDQKVLSRRGVQDPVGMLTPGYTTSDDFGTDGDDTQHSTIPHYEPPAYVQGNVTILSGAGQVPEHYDVVYIKHMEPKVLAALKCLDKTQEYKVDDYTDATINTNTLLQLYAQKYWNQPLQSCAVGGAIG